MGCIQRKTNSIAKMRENAKTALPWLDPAQSTNSNKDSSAIYILTQSNKFNTNDSLKTELVVLYFQMLFGFSFLKVQKRYNGAALQTFFCFLLTKEPCQLNKVSSTDKGRTLTTPNNAKSKGPSSIALGQWRWIWSMDSTLLLHR